MTQLGFLFAQAQEPEVSLVGLLIYLAIIVLIIAGAWSTFAKAGKPGWACLIPIYNFIVLLQIAGRPIWWVLLMLIPLVNFVVSIVVALDVARNFGRSAAFGIGLAFLPFIFYPILGFSDAQYRGGALAAV